MKLYLFRDFDRRFLPIPAARVKDWWQNDGKTRNHARHCLPLAMANSLGFYVLSPAGFRVRWDGDLSSNAEIDVLERTTHGDVDNHAAHGSFAIQPGFVPVTKAPGDFLYVKGVPNERCLPYACMEAVIEAWWNPGNFGLVFLLNQPGEFEIKMGQPIAQLFVFRAAEAVTTLEAVDEGLPEHEIWRERREREGYQKDFDYFRGLHPDGRAEPTHISDWNEISRIKKGTTE